MLEHANRAVIVFIDGPFPTEADLALAEKHRTIVFRNARENCLPVEEHAGAVAVDPELIPEGYHVLTEEEGEALLSEGEGEAPTLNPTAGTWKPGAPAGPIVSDEE